MALKLNIKKGDSVITLPKSCMSVLSDADASDLRVLIYAAACEREGSEIDVSEAARELMIGESEVNSSLKFWCGAGVLKKGAPSAKETEESDTKKTARRRRALPEKRAASFTTNELCEIADINEEFKVLIDAAQQTAGWIFNTKDIEVIADLYSNLMLSSEYILALIGYFVRKREKPLRYLVSVANDYINDGIDSAKALEEKLQWLEKFDGRTGKVRIIFGIGGRSFTKKEEMFLSDWFDVYKASDELIKAAYEITVNNTGKASLSYANTILKNWHEEGVKTPADIGKKDSGTAKKAVKTTRAGTATARSFDVNDALSKALERSYNGENK